MIDRDKECRKKKRYASRMEASEAVRVLFNEGKKRRVYECVWCRGFHLTSKT